METQGDRVNIEFDMPSRGIIGLRTNVLTASAGEAIMAHRFKCYQPYKGEIERRSNGSMIAMESGTAFAYAIDKLQDRGKFFIYPQDEVYAGQVVGEHVHENDLVINVTKSKKLTNMRASGSDDKARIIPPVVFSLEEALEYIKEDEYVEVTPKSMRMRKVILDETERKPVRFIYSAAAGDFMKRTGPPKQQEPIPIDQADKIIFSPNRPQSICDISYAGSLAINTTVGALLNIF